MASEVLQILNLSPIPELSEVELSIVLEQLSDQNGDITDRNVEDILREAEGLIDTSISIKTESIDSNNSFHRNDSRRGDDNIEKHIDIKNSKCDKESIETEDECSSKESTTDVLKLSMSNGCNSLENEKSENILPNKNEIDSSEITPVETQRYLTNHIQSTLISLREYSKKIESKRKTSSYRTEKQSDKNLPNSGNELPCTTIEENSDNLNCQTKWNKFNSHSEIKKASIDCVNESTKQVARATTNSTVNENSARNKIIKKGSRGLSLNESIQTLNCFERLYRGKSSREESKRLKSSEKISNGKRPTSMKVLKTKNPSRSESIHKVRKSKEGNSLFPGKEVKTYVVQEFEGKYNYPGENNEYLENVIDEEISFEKCLKLLSEESESQNSLFEMTSNYTEFAEKILKECTASVSALQGEVEDIKSQIKKNETKKDSLADSKDFIHQFCSQDNVVRILKEENSKLFKEIEKIKEQLKTNVETSMSNRAAEKVEVVEKLRSEVENLRRSLITAYSENNGISRLEEQFSSLKRRYDLQIGKLEKENRQLKDVLAGRETPEESRDRSRGVQDDPAVEAREVGIQTEREGETEWETRKMMRSASLDNCRRLPNGSSFMSNSRENVDVATSPIRGASLHGDRELCSVSVQCEGESESFELEGDESTGRRRTVGQFHRLENKENVAGAKKYGGKIRNGSNLGNQSLKQKKLSDHENELMITLRSLHSEITVKDRDNKKLRNELEAARNQIRRLNIGFAKHRSEVGKKFFHVGTQTIGLNPKIHEEYDPVMFQVSNELESENGELKSRVIELERVVDILKEKRIRDLQVLQKLHEEEIDKLASRLNTQTALTNHLHSLLTNR